MKKRLFSVMLALMLIVTGFQSSISMLSAATVSRNEQLTASEKASEASYQYSGLLEYGVLSGAAASDRNEAVKALMAKGLGRES